MSDFGATVGDEDEAVRAGRRLLVGALCTYGSFQPFNLADSLISKALKNLRDAEKPLADILDITSLVPFGDAKGKIAKLQEGYRNGLTKDLNRAVDSDPGGIMVSVVGEQHRYSIGQQGLSGFALLHSLTFEGVEDKTMKPIVKPVVRVGDSVGTLPKGQAVKTLFAEAA